MRNIATAIAALLLAGCGMPELSRDARELVPLPQGALERENGSLSVMVLDVGQGDAILIKAPSGEAMLVDTGPLGAGRFSILPLLAERGIERLSAAVITHYHSDHAGGLSEIAAGPDGKGGTDDDTAIETIYERSEQDDPEALHLADHGPIPDCPREALHPGDRIDLGDVSLEVLAANAVLADGTAIDPGDPADENTMGIALILSYKGFRMLLEADLTGGGGEPPYDTPDIETPLAALAGDVDVLKVAHHGSKTSTNQALLDAVTPEVAIISVGDDNDYGHPHGSVIERLIDSGAVVYQTESGWLDLDGPIVAGGDVTIEVDGDGEYRVIVE